VGTSATATTPTIVPYGGDTDTGLGNPGGVNILTIVTGGNETIRIDASGLVGINTSTSTNTLNILGDFNVTSGAFFGGNITTPNGGILWDNSTCTFLTSPDGSTTLEVCNV